LEEALSGTGDVVVGVGAKLPNGQDGRVSCTLPASSRTATLPSALLSQLPSTSEAAFEVAYDQTSNQRYRQFDVTLQ